MADNITPVAEWTPIPGWDDRTRNSGVEMNRQGEALANRIELVRDNQKRTPLHFATLAEASAAAATLPDGQMVESVGDEVTGVVSGGVITAEQSVYKVADYAKIRSYTGRGTRLRVVDLTGAHWWVRRGASADNGVTVLVDANGRSWERETNNESVSAMWAGFGSHQTASQNATSLLAALSALPPGGGRISLPAGEFNLGPFTTDKNFVLQGAGRDSTTLIQTGGISVNATVRRRAATFCDLSFQPAGANIPFAVKSIMPSGYIPKIVIERVDLRGPLSDVIGTGSPTPNFYYAIAFDLANLAFMKMSDIRATGAWRITEPMPGQPAHTFLKLSGPSARLDIDNVDVGAYDRVLEVAEGAEGFWINNCEWYAVRDGIVFTGTNAKPGGWINSLHINCSRYGIWVKNRSSFYIDNTTVLRGGSTWQSSTEWMALRADDCDKFQIGTFISRPDTGGLGGITRTIQLTNCQTFSIGRLYAHGTSQAFSLLNCSKGSATSVVAENCTKAVNLDSNTSDCTVLDVQTKNTPNVFSNDGARNRVSISNAYESVDGTATTINAAGSETISAASNQWIRRGFGPAGGSYVYDINMSNTGAVLGQFKDFTLDVSVSAATVNIKDATGVVQATIAGNIGKYSVRMVFVGQWRCVYASKFDA